MLKRCRHRADVLLVKHANLFDRYWTSIGKILANGQITNGGPVVLVQIENEYSFGEPGILYPDITYFGGLEQSFRDSGIVIPFTDNPAWAEGSFVPGTPAAVDIYG